MIKNYKSKLGLELIIPLILIFGYSLFELISNKVWIGIFVMVLTIIFLLYTFMSINYKIENDNLNVKCTILMNINIDIKSIRKII